MVGAARGRQALLDQMFYKLKNQWSEALDELLALSLAILICSSGSYAIPHVGFPADAIVLIKRGFYLLIMAMLVIQVIKRGLSGLDKVFSVSCTSLVLMVFLNAGLRRESYDEYGYMALSVGFVWLFVRYVQSAEFPLDRLLRHLRVGATFINLFALVVVLLSVAGDRNTLLLVSSGFNGNRVNFSIWLAQFVFLNFFLMQRQSLPALPLIASCVLLVLQVFTGGRVGVLATIAIMFYFLPAIVADWPRRLAIGAGILILVWVAGSYSPVFSVLEGMGEGTSIFRGLNDGPPSSDLLSYLDRISSHRLQITLTALKAMSFEDFFVGRGAGNFDVAVNGNLWMIHNVFLKICGEFGVVALLFLLAIVMRPLAEKYKNAICNHDLHFMWATGAAISLLQPRFLVTGLSNCLVMWLCYALILRQARIEVKVEGDMRYAMRGA